MSIFIKDNLRNTTESSLINYCMFEDFFPEILLVSFIEMSMQLWKRQMHLIKGYNACDAECPTWWIWWMINTIIHFARYVTIHVEYIHIVPQCLFYWNYIGYLVNDELAVIRRWMPSIDEHSIIHLQIHFILQHTYQNCVFLENEDMSVFFC
jgi:hypothetical protein